jgi:hypothetical protein
VLDERYAQAIPALQLSVVELNGARDHFEERGFTGAVATDEPHSFAGKHREPCTVEKRAVAVGEMSIENCD